MERDESGRFLPRQERRTRTYSGPASAGAYGGAESRPWQQQRTRSERESCVTTGTAASALGVVAGAGIGAALMFLLDPDQGRRRRERLAAAAAAAAERAGEVAHSAWDTTSDKAIEGAAAAYAAMPSRKDMRRGGRRLWGRTSDAFGSAAESTSDTASSWLDTAKSYLPELPHVHVHRASQHRTRVGAGTAGAGAASALLLGLGAMWLFDPDRGRGRRAWIGQKTNRLINETGTFMRATGRHLSNKSKGYYHQSRKAVGNAGQSLSDSSVAERIRASLAKLGLKSSSSVGVECSGGCVTLTGRCVADDVDVIIATTRDSYGVDNVINNMEVGTNFDSPTSSMPSSI
jgi:hypothetical protein